MKENKAIEYIKSKGLMGEFEKFKEVPEVEFKVQKNTSYDFRINAYVGDEYISDMCFNNIDDYSKKIYEFNKMIENVYKKLGVMASQEEILDEAISKHGFSINSVISDWNIDYSHIYLYALTLNSLSNNLEKTQLVYEAIKAHRDYLKKAFGVKEQNGLK